MANAGTLSQSAPITTTCQFINDIFPNRSALARSKRFLNTLLRARVCTRTPTSLMSLSFVRTRTILYNVSPLHGVITFDRPCRPRTFPVRGCLHFNSAPHHILNGQAAAFILASKCPCLVPAAPAHANQMPIPVRRTLPVVTPHDTTIFTRNIICTDASNLIVVAGDNQTAMVAGT